MEGGRTSDREANRGLSVTTTKKNDGSLNGAILRRRASREPGVIQCITSKRWILAYVAFYGSVCLYLHRVNLNLAIICMVRSVDNRQALPQNTTETEQQNTTTAIPHNATSRLVTEIPDTILKNETSYFSSISQHHDYQPVPRGCGESLQEQKKEFERAEFDWDKPLMASLLSSYFYGVVWTQILGGVIATKMGSKKVIGVSMAIQCLCCLLTPLATRTSVYWLFAVRVLTGLCGGVINPAFFSLWARWSPEYERGKLQLMNDLGSVFGTVLSFSTSGYLCMYGFDNGWASTFYIHGLVTIGFLVLWLVLVTDSPRKHPTISQTELDLIEGTVGNSNTKVPSIPWKHILTSPAVIAEVFAHVCTSWSFYVILTTLPLFMKEVLKFDIQQNGLYSSLPHISMAITIMASGHISDVIRENGILGTLASRRVFQSVALLGMSACLLGTCFITCEQPLLAVLIICLCTGFLGMSAGGYVLNCLDISARYSGIVYGVSNTIANLTGTVAPITVGLQTPNNSHKEWNNVFYVCIAISVTGSLVFALFSEGKVQWWARTEVSVLLEDKENVKGAEDKQ